MARLGSSPGERRRVALSQPGTQTSGGTLDARMWSREDAYDLGGLQSQLASIQSQAFPPSFPSAPTKHHDPPYMTPLPDISSAHHAHDRRGLQSTSSRKRKAPNLTQGAEAPVAMPIDRQISSPRTSYRHTSRKSPRTEASSHKHNILGPQRAPKKNTSPVHQRGRRPPRRLEVPMDLDEPSTSEDVQMQECSAGSSNLQLQRSARLDASRVVAHNMRPSLSAFDSDIDMEEESRARAARPLLLQFEKQFQAERARIQELEALVRQLRHEKRNVQSDLNDRNASLCQLRDQINCLMGALRDLPGITYD
ncbi:hypothetical protein PM082_011140 [Marasmius tenuissimus]|nr:hypothetical protein PM082_011140 [Marasmius tenuissimus]